MNYTHNTSQNSLFQFGLMKIQVSQDHDLVKMGKELDWESMIDIVKKLYSFKKGRNTKSLRMMIALEIAKRKYGMSDEEIINQLKNDVALKVFCGFLEWEHDIPHSSTMTKFRNRLDGNTLSLLEEVNIKKFIRKAPKRRRHQVIGDTTCVEANVTYPTDTKLLTKSWENLIRGMEKIRKCGVKMVIRGRRTTKKAIRAFNLKRIKSRNEFKKMNKKLIRESKKLIKKISIESKNIFDKKVKKYCKKIISVVEKIIDQQVEMIEEKKRYVKDRIISFHETEIRPIFRGKDRNRIEFGPKLGVSVIAGGLIQTSKLANNNFSDTEMVEASIDVHKKTFKRPPHELVTDRGGHSPKNHNLLEKEGIKDGVQYRGRIPLKANLPPPVAIKRMAKQRVVVEGKIGTFKTKYKGAKNEYKNANAQAWISFGFMAMNAKWATSR